MPNERQRIGRLASTWIEVDGRRLHTRVSLDPVPAGSPAVVLVHGLGVSSRYLVPTGERLAPDCRVYAPDLPGFGKSPKPRHVLTLPELADTLVAWMEAVGLERAAMLGNSLGCQIIAHVAVRHPARLERAVLVGPTMDVAARTARQQFGRVLLDTPFEAPGQPLIVIHDYLQAGLGRAWRTLQYALADPIEEMYRQVRVPALVVRGGLDPIVPQRWAEQVARLLPFGRLIVIPRTAHTVNYSAPDKLVQAVGPFLREAPPAVGTSPAAGWEPEQGQPAAGD